jgi:hypothetical protein
MIIDQMTATDRVEYLENLLKVSQTTLESVTEQRDRLAEELNELKEECGLRWAQKRIAIDELKDVTEQRDRLLVEREQWRLSSVCRIMKRDLEKARIENDWLGERLDKMEIDKNKAEAERNLWKAEAERWREQTGENFQVTAWKQLIEQERNRMRGL